MKIRRRIRDVFLLVALTLACEGDPAREDAARSHESDTRGADTTALDATARDTSGRETVLGEAGGDSSPGDHKDAYSRPELGDTKAPRDIDGDTSSPSDIAVSHDAPPAEDLASPAEVVFTPPSLELTVNRIPAAMNGSIPYRGPDHPETAFRLRVPEHRFTVDVRVRGSDLDLDSLTVEATLTNTAGERALHDITDRLQPAGEPDDWRTWRTRPEDGLAPGPLELTASVRDHDGALALSRALEVDVAHLPPSLDPFVAPDLWLVVLSRDLFSLALEPQEGGGYHLAAEFREEGSGTPDFDEALMALGLLSAEEDVAALVRERVIDRIRAISYEIFALSESGEMLEDSVPIELVFEGSPDAPDPADFEAGGFSMIAIGGDGRPFDIENRVVGRALLDPNNQHHEDNAVYGLGVFTSQIVRMVLSYPIAMTILGEISPVEGNPIGEIASDWEWLVEDLDPAEMTQEQRTRRHIFSLTVDLFSLAVAVTLCHEIGHSLGLVAPGVPPYGLFGGVAGLTFTNSDLDDWHIDTAGLNVMQTGAATNWFEAMVRTPHFNPLNMAYLRRALIVAPQGVPKGRFISWPQVTRGSSGARREESP